MPGSHGPRKWLRTLGLLVALGVCLTVAYRAYAGRARYASTGDVLSYVALGWDERTVYAPGFTELGFSNVKLGMSESEVLARLGKPLYSFPNARPRGHVLCFSSGDKDGTYWARYVEIDSAGRVTAKDRFLYFD